MPILFVFLALAIVYPLIVLWDARTMVDPETGGYKAQRLGDSIVLFAPFITLFYHEHFWAALFFYFCPFYAYCALVTYGIYRWKKIAFSREMFLINGSGSVVLVLIAYYLFFHDGALVAETVAVQNDTQDKPWWIWWPFVLIGISGAVTARLNSETLLWILGLSFLVIPFFSHHPVWAMVLASLVFLKVCFSFAQKQGNGAYVAVFMFYMMAQMAALIAYAVLF